jgi:hypothetical protein
MTNKPPLTIVTSLPEKIHPLKHIIHLLARMVLVRGELPEADFYATVKKAIPLKLLQAR